MVSFFNKSNHMKGSKEVFCLKRRLFSLIICLFLFIGLFSVTINLVKAPTDDGIFEIEIPIRGTFLKALDDWPYYGPGKYDYDENLEMQVGTRTDYPVEQPAIIDLQANGLNEGDRIYVSWVGGFYPQGAWYPDNPERSDMGLMENEDIVYGALSGLFSTSNQLGGINSLNRVSGAIDYGEDYDSPQTWWSEQRTEVSEKLDAKGIDWYEGPMPTDIPEDFIIDQHFGMAIEIPRNAQFLFISVIDPYMRDNLEGPNPLIVTIEKDTDGDGLPDSWELNGIDVDKDGETDLDLQMLGADFEHKDIFVEIDYMNAHRPNQYALDSVIEAFRKAPVKNPDMVTGINLHLIVDEIVPYKEVLSSFSDAYTLKSSYFGTENERLDQKTVEAKKNVFRYCLSVDRIWFNPPDYNVPGVAEGNACDDFIVAFGAFSISTNTIKNQAALFMHELGHSLGLGHGGGDDVNYKPNYLSIMNYMFTYGDLLPGRPLDYSTEILSTLKESNLDERVGIGKATKTIWYLVPLYDDTFEEKWYRSDGNLAIDWNIDGNLTIGVKRSLNQYPNWTGYDFDKLEGYDDWENLVYRFRGTSLYQRGATLGDYHIELTTEEIEQMVEDAKNITEVPAPEVVEFEFSELQVDVSALGTFLRADPIMEEGGSPVEPPTIIDLEATGILGEKWILISYSGEIFHAIDWGDGDPKEDGYINLIGIFSTTAELESIDNLNRVPGAIASNVGFETDETYFTEMSTDIPEDFLSGDHTGTKIEIPDGAKFLFLCNPDVYYPDNFGTFQVTIKTLETGQSDSVFPIEIVIIIILAIVATTILFIVYKRKKGNESKNVTG